ncbi:MAG: hypothetical protein WCK59_02995 [Candidatus Falkowbacteria bacterium]
MKEIEKYLNERLGQVSESAKSWLSNYIDGLGSQVSSFISDKISETEQKIKSNREKTTFNFKQLMNGLEEKRKKEPELKTLWDRMEKSLISDFERQLKLFEEALKSHLKK